MGGGGPTAGRRPVVVVNAMEGEPASAKDRVLLTWSPHLVLDGAEVAAAAVGARQIVVCVADDRDASARGGRRRPIAERATGRSASQGVTVVRPPGRYVTGEESALVAWLDAPTGARPVLRVDKSVPLAVGPTPGAGAQRRDARPGGADRPARRRRGSAGWDARTRPGPPW